MRKGYAVEGIERPSWRTEFLQQKLKGRVVDDSGKPISGVTVSAKDGRSLGVTNQDGMFEFVGAELGDSLFFSYVGYVPNEMPVSNFEELHVVMTAQQGNIDEVVVVGHGTQRRLVKHKATLIALLMQIVFQKQA